jgi:hypothetical protein
MSISGVVVTGALPTLKTLRKWRVEPHKNPTELIFEYAVEMNGISYRSLPYVLIYAVIELALVLTKSDRKVRWFLACLYQPVITTSLTEGLYFSHLLSTAVTMHCFSSPSYMIRKKNRRHTVAWRLAVLTAVCTTLPSVPASKFRDICLNLGHQNLQAVARISAWTYVIRTYRQLVGYLPELTSSEPTGSC